MAAPVTRVERSLLDNVLAVVRELGAAHDLREVLADITHAIVDVLGFGAVAVNLAGSDGWLRVEAALGPPGVEDLIGTAHPAQDWLDLLDSAVPLGQLRYLPHDTDQGVFDRFATWVPDTAPSDELNAWHPEDSLFAPLWHDGELIGVLSVDEPKSGRLPSPDECAVLETFAAQVGAAIRIAQSRAAGEARHQADADRWQLAFDESPTGIALLDAQGVVTAANEALSEMLGVSRDHLIGRSKKDLTHPDDIEADLRLFRGVLDGQRSGYRLPKRYVRPDGAVVHALLSLRSIEQRDGAPATILAHVVDVTEQVHAERKLEYERTHDALTGLPNRAKLGELIADQTRRSDQFGVLFCDLDRFRLVNDSLGRAVSDTFLVSVAWALQRAMPAGCVLARTSGDEFAVLAPGYADPVTLRALGDHLISCLAQPLHAGEITLTVGMSVGAAVYQPGDRHPDEVLREAEQAMLRAKERGRGLVEVYDPVQDRSFGADALALEQGLREAISSPDQLSVHLQPIVSVADGSVVGSEALVRWQHPTRGLLEPSAFLPLAESGGLIVPLGWRALALGIEAAAEARADRGFWVAVNVAAGQLGRGLLADLVRAMLANHNLPPAALHLEITESALVDASPAAIDEVREVAGMGVSIALDDFGTGYSSLTLLRDLPISVVKIDRSFIAPIADDRRAAALVRGLVVMCSSLGIRTVAEGVETPAQLAMVGAIGCDQAQGYLFGRPQPVSELDLTVGRMHPAAS